MYLFQKRKLLQAFAPGWLTDFRSRSIVLVAVVCLPEGLTWENFLMTVLTILKAKMLRFHTPQACYQLNLLCSNLLCLGRIWKWKPYPVNLRAIARLSGWLPSSRNLKSKIDGSHEAARWAVSLPILLFHGMCDEVVPYKYGEVYPYPVRSWISESCSKNL